MPNILHFAAESLFPAHKQVATGPHAYLLTVGQSSLHPSRHIEASHAA